MEKSRLLVIIYAWNGTQMNNRENLDEPMWFEVAIYSATGSTIVLIQSGLWFFSDDKVINYFVGASVLQLTRI